MLLLQPTFNHIHSRCVTITQQEHHPVLLITSFETGDYLTWPRKYIQIYLFSVRCPLFIRNAQNICFLIKKFLAKSTVVLTRCKVGPEYCRDRTAAFTATQHNKTAWRMQKVNVLFAKIRLILKILLFSKISGKQVHTQMVFNA